MFELKNKTIFFSIIIRKVNHSGTFCTVDAGDPEFNINQLIQMQCRYGVKRVCHVQTLNHLKIIIIVKSKILKSLCHQLENSRKFSAQVPPHCHAAMHPLRCSVVLMYNVIAAMYNAILNILLLLYGLLYITWFGFSNIAFFHFQARSPSGKRGFISEIIENIKQDMNKNKEMKVNVDVMYSRALHHHDRRHQHFTSVQSDLVPLSRSSLTEPISRGLFDVIPCRVRLILCVLCLKIPFQMSSGNEFVAHYK
jgi:hypothetical protein